MKNRKKLNTLCFDDCDINTQRATKILESLISQSYKDCNISWKAGHIGRHPVFFLDFEKITKSQRKEFLMDLSLDWSRAGFAIVQRKKDTSIGFKALRIELERFC